MDNAIKAIHNKTEELIALWGRPEKIFKIDKNKTAFIVIDMQNFTCSSASKPSKPSTNKEEVREEIKHAVKNINLLSDLCREEKIPVIWVKHNFTITDRRDDSGLYGKFFKDTIPESMCNLSEGTELYKELHIDEKTDHVILKNRYSAFIPAPSKIDELLKKLGRTQLIFAGIASNVCVESTIRDAMQLDYEVILVSDGTASIDKIMYEMTLANIKLFFGDVRSAKDILNDLQR